MANDSRVVQYQVERRPITKTGVVYRGLKPGDYVKAGTEDQKGEPWIVHSTHYSIPSALESATKLATAIGSENMRIVSVIHGQTNFTI